MNGVFHNKKRMIATAFTLIYTVLLITDVNFAIPPLFQSWRYAVNSLLMYFMPLITSALTLVYLLSLHKEYPFKKCLLPIAFAVNFVNALISVIMNFPVAVSASAGHLFIMSYGCSCLYLIAIAFMFAGTFKRTELLRYGALGCAALSLAILIIVFIQAGGFTYLQVILQGAPAMNILVLIRYLAQMLFYIGVYIFASGKRSADPLDGMLAD